MSGPGAREERVGQVLLDKLLVVKRLGAGGMGDVYEVEHLLTRHHRALKIVPAELAKEPRFAERFRREAGIAGRLKTPFVAETFDAGWLDDGSAYVLMELLHGRSLHALLAEEGMLSAERAASLMCQVAEGIQVAHDASIVHRDLKPENVFVENVGGVERVKILDFGVSKHLALAEEQATRLTREGSAVGTPYYMSPEQAAGKELDARSDVWSMGVMTYEILTGRLPFDGATVGEVMLKIGGGTYVPLEHRRPDVDPAFVGVVARALRADVNERYPTAEAMRRDLLAFASGEPAARAKTISDGASSLRSPTFPKPAPLPADLEIRRATPTSDRVRTARSDPSRPALTRSDPSRARIGTSTGDPPNRVGASTLALGLVAVLVVATIAGGVAGSFGRGGDPIATVPSDAGVRAAVPVAIPEPPPVVEVTEPPPIAPEVAIEVPTAPERTETTTVDDDETPTRPRTRAEVAGLEGNPYGP